MDLEHHQNQIDQFTC